MLFRAALVLVCFFRLAPVRAQTAAEEPARPDAGGDIVAEAGSPRVAAEVAAENESLASDEDETAARLERATMLPSGDVEEPTATASLRDAAHSIEGAIVLYQLTRPGGQVGYSYRLLETPDHQHALVVGADLGVFVWPQREVGIFLLPRVSWRGRFDFGLQFEVALRVGVLHSVPASSAYSVDDAGRVESHVSTGYTFADFGPAIGIGWAIRELGLVPFARVGAVWIAPVFDQFMLRLDVTIGAEVMLP